MCFFGGDWDGISFVRIKSIAPEQAQHGKYEYSLVYPRSGYYSDQPLMNPSTWSLNTASKISEKTMNFILQFLPRR